MGCCWSCDDALRDHIALMEHQIIIIKCALGLYVCKIWFLSSAAVGGEHLSERGGKQMGGLSAEFEASPFCEGALRSKRRSKGLLRTYHVPTFVSSLPDAYEVQWI